MVAIIYVLAMSITSGILALTMYYGVARGNFLILTGLILVNEFGGAVFAISAIP